jgi:hypothetical protein
MEEKYTSRYAAKMEWLYPQPFGNEEIADVHFEPQKTVGRSYALFVHRVSECCGSCAADKTGVEATPANFFCRPDLGDSGAALLHTADHPRTGLLSGQKVFVGST